MSRAASLTAAGVFVAALVAIVIPFATKDRQASAGTPQPYPLFSTATIELRPGQQACQDEVVVEPGSQVASIQVGTFRHPGVPLALTLRGPGYHATVRARHYEDNQVLALPLRPPPSDRLVVACVRDEGRSRITLYASGEARTHSRGTTTVAGRRVRPNFDLLFYERAPATLAGRASTVVARSERFRPGFVGGWLLWPLAALFLLGVPAGIVYALGRAGRQP